MGPLDKNKEKGEIKKNKILHIWEQIGYVRQPLRCTHHSILAATSFRVICKLTNNYLFSQLMSDICQKR